MKNIDINPPCPIHDRDYQIHSHLVTFRVKLNVRIKIELIE